MEKITPVYRLISTSGPDHVKIFTVGAFLNKRKIAQGKGKSKQEAEQKAAQKSIPCTHVVKFGDIGKAVEEINREYRRIELVITDSPSKREELHARVNLPVFNLKPHR